jgi:anti-sigma-K factor RskA
VALVPALVRVRVPAQALVDSILAAFLEAVAETFPSYPFHREDLAAEAASVVFSVAANSQVCLHPQEEPAST